MKYQQSETVIIKRSQINFAPYNPKKHSKEAISQQAKNIRQVGILGGIIWNRLTGNLVSGHKRVMALNKLNKYDGTPETDYDIKVEAVEMDEKTEKEQNIYMDNPATNTKQDYELLSALLPDIDYKNAGITDDEYKSLSDLNTDYGITDSIETQILDIEEFRHNTKPTASKEEIKDVKEKQKERAQEHHMNLEAYITLSFSNSQAKEAFCEMFGYDPYNTKYIKGEDILNAM